MKTRTVFLCALWVVVVAEVAIEVGAAEPPRPRPVARPSAGDAAKPKSIAPEVKSEAAKKKEAETEAAAERLGVSVEELKTLRGFGFTDTEVVAQTRGANRTAQEVITECKVFNDVSKAIDEIKARVYKLPASRQEWERARSLKAALAKVRRDHHLARDDLRRMLTDKSYLTADELNRAMGIGFPSADDLKRVIFKTGEDVEDQTTPGTSK